MRTKGHLLLIKHYDHEAGIDVESYINPEMVVGVQDTTLDTEPENGPPREVKGATIRFVDGSEIFLLDDRAEFIAERILGYPVMKAL
jgi:hypothetical protein